MLRPVTIRAAKKWNAEVHRRLPALQGAMWSVQLRHGGQRVGVAIVGHPAQEWTNEEEDTLAVLRVAVLESPTLNGWRHGGCSMLYGSCSRAARDMGALNLVTYTHLDEPGTSLRASGWIDGGLTDGGEWDRPGRPRQLVIDSERKRRWWAPWSAKSACRDCGTKARARFRSVRS